MKKCSVCNKDFEPKRSTARFCSSDCRIKAHRDAVTLKDTEKLVDVTLSEDNEVSVTEDLSVTQDSVTNSLSVTSSVTLILPEYRDAKWNPASDEPEWRRQLIEDIRRGLTYGSLEWSDTYGICIRRTAEEARSLERKFTDKAGTAKKKPLYAA
jgi:hypothetical protein